MRLGTYPDMSLYRAILCSFQAAVGQCVLSEKTLRRQVGAEEVAVTRQGRFSGETHHVCIGDEEIQILSEMLDTSVDSNLVLPLELGPE